MDEDVRPPRFHEDSVVRHNRHAPPIARIQHRGGDLTDEQRFPGIRNLHLERQCPRRRVDDARMVHVLGLEHKRRRQAGNVQLESGNLARDGDICRGNLDLQFDAIRAHDPEQRRALVIRRAERGQHFGQPPANGRPQGK